MTVKEDTRTLEMYLTSLISEISMKKVWKCILLLEFLDDSMAKPSIRDCLIFELLRKVRKLIYAYIYSLSHLTYVAVVVGCCCDCVFSLRKKVYYILAKLAGTVLTQWMGYSMMVIR